MKRAVLFLLVFMATAVYAQNLQFHYDMNSDREYVTTTLEMFKPDALGSTFWFVDMDYASNDKNKSASLGYFEIARYFTLPVMNKRLSATIQYNDGAAVWGPLHSVWLGGLSYFVPFAKGNFSVDFLYRHMDVSDSPDGQFTLVWFYPLLNGKLHFMGFLDYWTQDMMGDKKGVLLTEPQVWYQLNNNIAIGGEVEISKNFLYGLYEEDVKFFPTLGVKWTF